MIRIIKKEVTVTAKGELLHFQVKLPHDAKKIRGVMVVNDVDSTLFPVDTPYVDPPPSFDPDANSDTEFIIKDNWFYAIANHGGAEYSKWDRLRQRTTFTYENGSLLSTATTWYNLNTNSTIAVPTMTDLAHENEPEFNHEELVENQSFTLTNVKQNYPFGLTIPTAYKFVKIIAEADASLTANSDLKRIARVGITADLSSSVGTPLGDNSSVDLSKEEFEQSSMIGIQAGKTHNIQLQFIN